MDYEPAPFPIYRWGRVYRTYACSQCGKIVRWGQPAYLEDLDEADFSDERQALVEEWHEEKEPEHSFAYLHYPREMICSEECLKSAESDHWEEEADYRRLHEEAEAERAALRALAPRKFRRRRRRKARTRTVSAPPADGTLPEWCLGEKVTDQGPDRVEPDHQTSHGALRGRRHVDEVKAEALVDSFSRVVAEICLRLEEVATACKWADSQRGSHKRLCDCDRCTLAKRLRGEFAALARAVRALVRE